MSAKVLAFISERFPWGDSRPEFRCIVCEKPCVLDNYEPFCSDVCRAQQVAPEDVVRPH